MDVHGDIDLQHNKMHKMVFETETVFPKSPKVGRIIFKDQKLYMCAAINGDSFPIWIPLTNEIDTYIHTESSANTTWTVIHSMNTTSPIVQIYDSSDNMIIPDAVEIVSNNKITILLSNASAGKAVIMHGHFMPDSGIGIL
jgi:hypothetical protein